MSDDLGAPSGDSGDTPTRVAVPERAPREPTEPSAVRAGETGRSLVAGASLQSATTSRDALHLQEVVRTRFFVRLIGAFVVLVALLLPFIGGDPLAARLLWAGLAAVAAVSAWLGWRLRNPAAYRTGHVLVFGYACIFGGFTGIYYFGVFSPAVALIPVGIYFFSPGQSWSGALGVYITVALAQAAIMGAVGTGLVADRGLVRGDGLDGAQKAVMWLLLEAVYLAAFMIGRATRKATIEAIERHEKAVRALAAREALLAEARQDLDRALQAGGLGRYTDQRLGSFKLGKVIGRGGMGEVYEAVQADTGGAAAVKLLSAPYLAEPDEVRRFLRETRIVAALKDPHVVKVLEVGGADAPVPYLAMELLRGTDLAQQLRERGRVSVRFVVTLLRQVGSALAAARAAGIVHRDLKPRNLFHALPPAGQGEPVWKILDFGVSKLLDAGATVTRDRLVGTPAYMAPEQALGEAVSHRTDLWALGVICYRALTGRPAFTGGGTPETLFQVVHGMPPAPSELARLPAAVDLVLAVAMAKAPADRFDRAEELADALEAAGEGSVSEEVRARAEAVLARMAWGHAAGRGL